MSSGGGSFSGDAWATLGMGSGNGFTNVGPYGSTVLADGTIATVQQIPSAPQFCGCPNDVTSGVLGGTFASLPAGLFGPVPIVGGIPSAVQIVGLLFQYQGPNCCYLDEDGNPQLLFGNVDASASVVVNVWQEQVVDISGRPVTGDFQVNEQMNQMGSYGSMVNNGQGGPLPDTQAGPPWNGGRIIDNIGFPSPGGTMGNWVQQSFTVTYPNGESWGLSTVFNQISIYQNGQLVTAGPSVVEP